MSDTNAGPTEGNTAPQGRSAIQIHGQYIKDLSFEVPGAPQIFNLIGQNPLELKVSVNVKVNHGGNNLYEVTLQIEITAKAGEQTGFAVELLYGCIAALDETIVGQDQAHPILHIEIPRLMFPFCRQIIAGLSAEAGFPQMLLQPFDFAEMYVQRFGIPGQAQPDADAPPPVLN